MQSRACPCCYQLQSVLVPVSGPLLILDDMHLSHQLEKVEKVKKGSDNHQSVVKSGQSELCLYGEDTQECC